MENQFYIHEIRGKNNEIANKGIVVAETYDAAKQGYHAYLGAYAYGNNADTDFVSAMITDKSGTVLMAETWNASQLEPNA
ncbi:MAG: hypothetical protein IJH70_02540 [Oscillospiraceae bacterium]|nr:hypothetical protein [Oscillospiraceae bacterium]